MGIEKCKKLAKKIEKNVEKCKIFSMGAELGYLAMLARKVEFFQGNVGDRASSKK